MKAVEKILAKKWMIFLLFASLTYLFGTKTDRRYGWTNINVKEATPVYSDGAGYYAFLPEWFIYKGSNFEFADSIRQKYPDAGFEDNLVALEGNKKLNKYFTGTAQCLTPFFLVGHAHAKFIGEDADGYTWPYLLWLNAGMIAYGILGLIALFLLFQRLKISYFASYLVVILLAVATNLSFYVYFEIPYAHVFSFATINLCLLQGIKWKQERKGSALLVFMFLLGLAIVIRPTNIFILVLVPFLFANTREFIDRIGNLIRNQWKLLLFSLMLFAVPVIIQLSATYAQVGKIQLNSYSGEEFTHWKSPYMWQVLFGFRKGLFVYSPVLLLLFPGLVVIYFKSKRLFAGILIFGLIITYVLSSWWCWWYGGALGFRAMVDFLGILAIPIAFLIHYSGVLWRVLILIFVFCSAYIYQVYEFQYKKNIIHYDYMNYPMWKKIFLKEEPRLCWVFHSKIDTLPAGIDPVSPPLGFSVKDQPLSPDLVYGNKEHPVLKDLPEMGKHLDVKNGNSFVGARVSMKVYLNSPNENPTLLTQYFKGDSLVGQKETMVGWRPQNVYEWETISVDFTPGYYWRDVDSVSCRFHTRQDILHFQNLKIQFFEYK